MTSETTGQTVTVETEEAAAAATGPAAVKGERKCPIGDHKVQDDLRKLWTECHEESFWYRALPFSLSSMAVTGILIHNGILKSSQRFGPFPKLVVAGILGFAVGKASYVGICRSKFQQLGFGPEFGTWSARHCFGNRNDHGHGPRCDHVCDDCKKKAETAPTEVKS